MKYGDGLALGVITMTARIRFMFAWLLAMLGLVTTTEAKLGGFEPEDGYAWYYQTDFHRYNAGQYNSSSGTETPPFQTIPINTGLWVSNAGLDPSVGGSYIGAHPGGRNGAAKMAIKSMAFSAGNFDMDYHFDSLDFDGNNPDTIKNATVEISYWFCPSVNNLPGVPDTISFFGANGNHLVSLGTKYSNASPRLVYSTTSHTAGWVDTGLNANPADWDQVQLLITLSTTSSDRLTLSFVSSSTGDTTVLLNDVAVAANIDALDKLKFTHNKDAINGKYYYDDFEFTVSNIQNTCDITGLVVTPSACNNNSTPNDSTDDYYNASVTVSFENKPASGNLVLSGAALHATNSVSSVAVGSTTSATSHTFANVRLKANGVANALTSTFSADSGCTLTINSSAVGACSIPDCDMTSLVITPGNCNDNGTPNDNTDDYYNADVTANFSNKPATGNLTLSGVALHSTNSVNTVAVGATTTATSHTFSGVRLKANGLANSLKAEFVGGALVGAVAWADWTAQPSNSLLTGTILVSGSPATISAAGCVIGSVINGSASTFSDALLFNPSIAAGDAVRTDNIAATHGDFVITFSSPITDPVFHIADRHHFFNAFNHVTGDPITMRKISGNLGMMNAAFTGFTETEGQTLGRNTWTVPFITGGDSNGVGTTADGTFRMLGTFTQIRMGFINEDYVNFQVGDDTLDECALTVNAPSVNECSTPDCDITDLVVTPGACNNNSTPSDSADDYYTANVSVTFSNKPATGNLVLSGVALHSSNTVSTVAVGSTTSATTHNFAGVRLKANGVANAITATFSGDPACTMTINGASIPSCSTPVDCCPELIIDVP